MLLLSLPACKSPGEWARLRTENEALLREKQRLERLVGQRAGTIAQLHEQVENLAGFGPDRPAACGSWGSR